MIQQISSIILCALAATQVAARPQLVGRQAQTTTTATSATPTSTPYIWNKNFAPEYIIHESCNSTERAQLLYAFEETSLLATHAKNHILAYGSSSPFYKHWFGSAKTGEPMGWYEKIARGNKGAMVWRCDDIDNRCSDPERPGYNREESHFEEAITCPYSYASRLPLTKLCAFGYTVAKSEDNTVYFASDIMHRMFHMPGFGEELTLDHYADGYENCTLLAREEPGKAVRNSATLRLFALDVYAFDVAVPGVGCMGVERLVEV